jgi:hypothetical protein
MLCSKLVLLVLSEEPLSICVSVNHEKANNKNKKANDLSLQEDHVNISV